MRFRIPYNYYRVMGISGLFLIGYIVVIGIFGNVDVSWMLPIKLATTIQEAWPQMPFFSVGKDAVNNGRQQEVLYTVPSRLLTPQEIAKMKEKKPTSSGAKAPQSK